MSDKTYRINKVASELNVSFQTLVEKLVNKGFEIEAKPTAKISAEMYDFLLSEFKSDKAAKDESKSLKLSVQKDKIKETPSTEIVIKPGIKSSQKEDEKEEEDDQVIIKNKLLNQTDETQEHKQQELIENKLVEHQNSAEETNKNDESTVLKGPKVIGKINLDKISEKTRPATKTTKAKVTDKSTEEKQTKENENKVVNKIDTPPVIEKEAKPIEPESEEVELIKTQYEKLKGLSVKGKIELKAEPVITNKSHSKSKDNSQKPFDKKKRVRKVVEKVKIEEAIKDKPQFGKKKKSDKPKEITEKEIQDRLKATLSRIETTGRGKTAKSKIKRQRREYNAEERLRDLERLEKEEKVLKVTEFISANELASLMNVGVTEIITACFSLGLMVSINQRLDAETISIVADEFGFEVDFVDADAQLSIEKEEDKPEDLLPRAPIVTVMGHVDHGKTSLLDYIRSANVIAGEAGGITQHIGAYEVVLQDKQRITFLDTPGHEAFTAMRARGAKLTDIAVIVIAADDSIMPQTREAISHAQAAGVPMIFAINKIDKPAANPDKIREELSQMNILVEEWGGKYQCQEIAAKFGKNVDKLLEKIILEAELLELKANPNKHANGTVIEAKMDKGRGILANLLVQAGTLKVGDHMVAGAYYGKIKALFNERFQRIEQAGPSSPVSVLGFSGAPTAGDPFQVFPDEASAKDLANRRFQLLREQGIRSTKHITLDEIGRRLAVGSFKELNLIVRADVDGSVEALSDSLLKLSTDEIQINIIHKGVGQITESDVLLASASDAIIIGFQVRPAQGARKLAETEQIDIRHYSIIYKAIEEIKSAMEGMLSPELVEKIVGEVEVREVFNISKLGTIAGCMVLDGKITRNSNIRLIRDGVVIHTGKLASLKRFKDDVKEVTKGFECGLHIEKFNDLQIGDNIEVFTEEEVKRKLK
ncbi:MAG: translation initiation factor IF-2 [Bacteroidetes bacterium]|nr:translation initiation factor IF-2 [Bacteroidota bacterium]